MLTRLHLRAVVAISAILALVVAGLIPATVTPAGAADAPMAQVRLFHAVAGAPAVDVYIDGMRVFGGAAYGDFSTYENVSPGNHLVQAFPTGASSTGTGLLRARMMVQAKKMYTLALGGAVGRIIPVVIRDDTKPPTKGMARVRVVHLSADTPAVDVAIKGGATLFTNARFGSVSASMEIAPATVDIQVRPAGWAIAARTLPMVAITAGNVYTFYAVGTQFGTARFRIVSDVLPTLGRIRLVHAVPGAGSVDVYVDGDRVFTGASYGDVSTYESVAGGMRHIQVFPSGTYANLVVPPSKGGIIDTMQSIVAGTDYTVIASWTAGKIAPVVLTDDNTAPSTGMVKVHVVHLSPDAPAVDVAGMMGKKMVPWATAVAYQGASAPVEVKPGSYTTVNVMPTNTTTVAAHTDDVTLAADGIYTIFVFGKAKGTPALNVLVNQDQ